MTPTQYSLFRALCANTSRLTHAAEKNKAPSSSLGQSEHGSLSEEDLSPTPLIPHYPRASTPRPTASKWEAHPWSSAIQVTQP